MQSLGQNISMRRGLIGCGNEETKKLMVVVVNVCYQTSCSNLVFFRSFTIIPGRTLACLKSWTNVAAVPNPYVDLPEAVRAPASTGISIAAGTASSPSPESAAARLPSTQTNKMPAGTAPPPPPEVPSAGLPSKGTSFAAGMAPPPPPGPPPPGLPPPVLQATKNSRTDGVAASSDRKRKTMTSEDLNEAEATQRSTFNAFQVPQKMEELIWARHVADSNVAETWKAWLQGECLSSEEMDFVRLMPCDWIHEESEKTITVPAGSMALWGLRELLICKTQMPRPSTTDGLREILLTAVQFLDDRETECANDLWNCLWNCVAENQLEAFARKTVLELLSGELVLQGQGLLGDAVWRAALGNKTASEFQSILENAIKEGFSTWSTARELQITHIAACTHWPLRMYLRLQLVARESVVLGVDTADKLKLLLNSEEVQIGCVYSGLGNFERRWLQALLC